HDGEDIQKEQFPCRDECSGGEAPPRPQPQPSATRTRSSRQSTRERQCKSIHAFARRSRECSTKRRCHRTRVPRRTSQPPNKTSPGVTIIAAIVRCRESSDMKSKYLTPTHAARKNNSEPSVTSIHPSPRIESPRSTLPTWLWSRRWRRTSEITSAQSDPVEGA